MPCDQKFKRMILLLVHTSLELVLILRNSLVSTFQIWVNGSLDIF